MAKKCPYCSASMPFGEIYVLGGMLGGEHYPLQCKACGRKSFIPRHGRNATAALIILAVAVVVSLPSPLWPAVPPLLATIARVGIWSVATLSAHAVFSFASPLSPLEAQPALPMSYHLRVRAVNLAIQLSMLVWMYIIFRGLWRS